MTSLVNGRLSKLRHYVTSEFAREPRCLDELEHWKATEYRQFLLYTGLYALKGCLSSCYYDHFLTLSVACHILMSPSLAVSHLDFARTLLRYFMDCGRALYGTKFLVYNVHLLLHIADDVAKHGVLDDFSAFVFENYLQKIKRTVRQGRRPLAQVVNRLR